MTAALGFRASGVSAGIGESLAPGPALTVNRGPSRTAAGLLTSYRVHAASVRWCNP